MIIKDLIVISGLIILYFFLKKKIVNVDEIFIIFVIINIEIVLFKLISFKSKVLVCFFFFEENRLESFGKKIFLIVEIMVNKI